MSAARVSSGSSIAGRLSGAGAAHHAGAQGVAAPSSLAPIAQPALAQIRYASTWPRGWMAAAVPQQVRAFNEQVSKAQMAQAFLAELSPLLQALAQATKHQLQLPSAAGQQRVQQALQRLQTHWRQRYVLSGGSLDERLQWSATQTARKVFELAGWMPSTLQAQHERDQELISFSLMGQEGAHGAWQAQAQRSLAASRFHLASALAPLGIQVHWQTQRVQLSVPELQWPMLQARMMVKGNGQRFPAGQWVAAPLRSDHQAAGLEHWSTQDEAQLTAIEQALPEIQARVSAVQAAITAFYEQAQSSLDPQSSHQALARMQQFSSAFQEAAAQAGYAWVSQVLPAVRSISRQRVARLLRRPMEASVI